MANWRRGFLRLGIVTAIVVLPALGGVAYIDWREQHFQQQRFQQIAGNAASARALYEMFVQRSRQTTSGEGLVIPDARVISRSAIPTAPTWPIPRVAVIFGALGFLLGLCASWVASGFRGK